MDLPTYIAGSLTVPILAAGVCLAAGYTLMKRSRYKHPLPPGPPGLPIIGNVFDIPANDFWLKYKEWSELYGSDVIYLNMVGTPVIVLNSLKAAKDLLERRSLIYSSRPEMPLMNDLIGFDWHLGFMEYGTKWKERRTAFQQMFHPLQMHIYRPATLVAVRGLLNDLLDDPEHFLEHGRRFSGTFILNVTYGLEIKSKDDIHIQQAERGMKAMAAAGTAITYLVDFIPALKHVPSWVPGAGFQSEAKEWRKHVLAMADSPYQYVKDSLAAGSALPCAATTLLEDSGPNLSGERESVVRDTLASVFAAGSDSTISPFGTFILAMLLNPEIQKKAQEAIDGSLSSRDGLLPDYSEYGNIPYIDAVVREVIRWRPATPIAVPHRVIQDDVYNGFYIPSGATIIPNCWAILHDPILYGPNPSSFDPSRFLDGTQASLNPHMPRGLEMFGFGRRVCPGIHIAMDMLWLSVVSILSVFDIKAVDGSPDSKTDHPYTSGLIRHPLPFKCRFVPRSEVAVRAVRNI